MFRMNEVWALGTIARIGCHGIGVRCSLVTIKPNIECFIALKATVNE
jgi:hypothetical protein